MDNIVYGVTSAINSYFGSSAKIYSDTVKQGFERPCFIVLPERTDIRQASISRMLKTLTVKIIYYPQSMKERDEMEKTAFKLTAAVRRIKWQGDHYPGKAFRWEEDNEKLTFRVEYDTVLYWDPSLDFEDDEDGEAPELMMKVDFVEE